MSKRYFVFIPGLRGPEGQILNEYPVSENNKKVNYLFGPVAIEDHETLGDCILKFKDNVDAPISS